MSSGWDMAKRVRPLAALHSSWLCHPTTLTSGQRSKTVIRSYTVDDIGKRQSAHDQRETERLGQRKEGEVLGSERRKAPGFATPRHRCPASAHSLSSDPAQ